jgi:hypothetical protein
MTDLNQIAELRGLVAKATQENLADGGRYFADSYTDLTRCRHEEIGEYQNRHDGPAIEALWNARHALLDAAERVGRLEEAVRAYCDAFDAGTGTVYVEPLMRSLLTDTTHDTAEHGEGE